ncbi:MAG: sugar phosphate nucleotidyltransferase [Balneolaceae bacterium]|nr:sugar phosphate nucleotidyltransferase [Balneolaceae bacterium]
MKRAIILAGGKGTRLRPYTIAMPKPLVPLGDKPILELIVIQLKRYGFTHITLTINHMADVIKAFFGDGSKWGVKIDYTMESKPLSTMGPLTLIPDLPDNFLVMNGDVLTDLDFSEFWQNHIDKKSIFTISMQRREESVDYGLLHYDDNNRLTRFEEKPTYEFMVSMGVYMINKKVMQYIPKDTFFGFDHLMYKLLDVNKPPIVQEHKGYWLDIGRPSDYEIATNKIQEPNFSLV